MTTENLMRATRNVVLLAPKPGVSAPGNRLYWHMSLRGLDAQDIKDAITSLRREHEKKAVVVSKIKALKITALQNALAATLGARSYDHWRDSELPRIEAFLSNEGMTRPRDLITWKDRPLFAGALTAQRLAERFFNSGLPLPKRLFTGTGSMLFATSGYGRMDIQTIAGRPMLNDEERLAFCMQHENDVLLRAHELRTKGPEAPGYIDLTGRTLALNAVSELIGGMYNLLGDNLCAPMRCPAEFTAYDTSAKDDALDSRIFALFRKEIEESPDGWMDVVPMPDNDNLVFLKGGDGSFDWVVREQRDEPFAGNPLYPIFHTRDLPSALQSTQKLAASLYFKRGEWRERLEHLAAARHYAEGGTLTNWPGYDKLVQRKLVADNGYAFPRPPEGTRDDAFAPHRLKDRCIMVSRLVTVHDFWKFYEHSEWRRIRAGRALAAGYSIEDDLGAVNLHDAGDAPASVTWFDALAYCRHVESETGLPVRLLDTEEWQEICPAPARDIAQDGWGDLAWIVIGGDGRTGTDSAHRYPEACAHAGWLNFGKEPIWSFNREGLPFLSVVDFGEWLGDYAHGHAAAANAATGKALMTGPLERDFCPANLTMRYKGLKVGFRLCYAVRSGT